MTQPKLLVLDIETKPSLSYHWRMFKENIGIDQVKEAGGILCVGAKWLGHKEVFMFSEWEHTERGMLEEIHALLMEADAVITKNGTKFDLPWLRMEMVKHRLPPLPTLTHIDLEKVVRSQFRFQSNKLDWIAQYLGEGKKVEHEGFPLWRKVMDGNEAARKKMLRYCKGDIIVTQRVYQRLRGWIPNHPHMAFTPPNSCGACGSNNVQSRGWRRTKSFRIQRLHCQNCGSWHDGRREKVKVEDNVA